MQVKYIKLDLILFVTSSRNKQVYPQIVIQGVEGYFLGKVYLGVVKIIVLRPQTQEEMGSLALVSHYRNLFKVKVNGDQPILYGRLSLFNAHRDRIILLKTSLSEPRLKFIPGA